MWIKRRTFFIARLACCLFFFSSFSLQAQEIAVDTLIKQIDRLMADSGKYEESVSRAKQLISEQGKQLSTVQWGHVYQLLGYCNIELANFAEGDSLLHLAEENLSLLSNVKLKDRLDLLLKQLYSAQIQGKNDQANALMKEAFLSAESQHDTLTKPFVSLLVKKAITQNNSYQFKKAATSLDRAESILRSMAPLDSVLLYNIKSTRVALTAFMDKTDSAYNKLLSILEYCRRNPQKTRDNYHRTLTLLRTLALHRRTNFNEAIDALDEMLNVVNQYYPPSHPLMARTLNEYADAYASIGDIKRTHEYASQAKYILNKIPGRSHLKYNNLTCLASCYFQTKNYKEAKRYYELAYRLSYSDDRLNPLLDYRPLLNIAACYQATNKLDSTKIILDFVRASFNSRNKPHLFTDGEIEDHYGQYFEAVGDYSQSDEHYIRSLKILSTIFSNYHQRTGHAHLKMAKIKQLSGQLDSAIIYANLTLEILKFSEAKNSKNINPTNYPLIISALESVGSSYFKKFLIDQNEQHLVLSGNAFDDAVLFIQHLRRYMNSQLTRQTLGEQYFSVYSGAVKTAVVRYRLNPNETNLNRIYYLIQSSKAQALLENIHETQFEHIVGIPSNLLDQEEKLQNKVTLLERRLKEDTYRTAKWTEEIFATNLELQDLLNTFKSKYPSYYKLKYDNSTSNISEVKNRLKSDEGLLEYFFNERQLHIVFITSSGARLYSKQIDDLEMEIARMREGISSYYLSKGKNDELFYSAKSKYCQSANTLYDHLIAMVDDLPKKLVIIPDGILGYIPFEALLTKPIDVHQPFNSFPYLIRSHEITYHYSSTLWGQTSKKKGGNNKLLAIAPDFTASENSNIALVRQGELLPLIGNLQEVEYIGKLFRSSLLIGNKATKQSFSALAPQHEIIHFATHAIVNDENVDQTYLALSQDSSSTGNEHLYIKDLYNTNLSAELVVLSACETGLGQLRKGEGIISLARGFAYAGANSVVTSLWSVSDKATANLMQLFYSQLKKGKQKDVSLRRAKLEFIESNDESFAAPFYWASTIAFGDMKPIKSNFPFYWLLPLGLILILAIRFRKRAF